MESVAERAFEARVGLSSLCHEAGVSRTVAYRWINGKRVTPLLPTIGKLEAQLDRIEHERQIASGILALRDGVEIIK